MSTVKTVFIPGRGYIAMPPPAQPVTVETPPDVCRAMAGYAARPQNAPQQPVMSIRDASRRDLGLYGRPGQVHKSQAHQQRALVTKNEVMQDLADLPRAISAAVSQGVAAGLATVAPQTMVQKSQPATQPSAPGYDVRINKDGQAVMSVKDVVRRSVGLGPATRREDAASIVGKQLADDLQRRTSQPRQKSAAPKRVDPSKPQKIRDIVRRSVGLAE